MKCLIIAAAINRGFTVLLCTTVFVLYTQLFYIIHKSTVGTWPFLDNNLRIVNSGQNIMI